ncbi:Rv3654c family TadE-like protein [uncultured Microbacterium sp.]|uniref:Rv3654c family TadE-like protein n=1 Tax=uncultured Microbacterium sp. TaxID=191216 RepID=UPI00261AF8D9|nr:Rv3654c family TadE-like protein [uncultured Microbacterium sp.]
MSGLALSVGALAVTVTLAVGCASLGAAAAHATRLSATADAAALAAADTASGLLAGIPCERAAEIVTRSGASLSECDVDGPVATVHVEKGFGLLPASARARAGPPP